MEFFQFHPTGIAGKGLLITEGARGEGGQLLNGAGERFMERYAPHAKELASRDVVSRAIATEIREGRGCGPAKDHVLLKLEHLGEEVVSKRLPGIRETVKTFLHIDPVYAPIPVCPTAHYVMGGIPTDLYGQVLAASGTSQQIVPGLYAAGECACVSIHGANRLGGNSLLDILVFGRAAGIRIHEFLQQNQSHRPLPEAGVEQAMARLRRWDKIGDGETVDALRSDLKRVMETHCGVFRKADVMQQGIEELHKLRERMPKVRIQDTSRVFNTARLEALELENLMDIAMATMLSAQVREESRGAHSRIDFPERDDVNWLQHTLYFLQGDRLDFRPVRTRPLSVETFPPKPRVY
jgi:succinate dehydrogenase / fumarate reductase flavoprotein subunit